MTYLHCCTDNDCKFEWEENYSIKADPPKICPKCNQETARRLINHEGGARMELNPDEMKDKIKEDVKKLKQEANKNENVLANLVGPKYEQNVKMRDKIMKDYGKEIFKRAK